MAADFTVRGDTRLDGSGFSDGLNRLGNAAKKGLKIVGAAVAGTLGAIATAGIKYNASMEQYQTAFKTMLGNADAADELTDSLKTLAAQTPMAMAELAEASKTRLAFGSTAARHAETAGRYCVGRRRQAKNIIGCLWAYSVQWAGFHGRN